MTEEEITKTPSEPTDLRTLAAEAIPYELISTPAVGIGGARRQKLADVVLAAVLPTHRATVLAEAADWIESQPSFPLSPSGDPEDWPGCLADAIRRLGATTSPAVPKPTVGSGDHPVVPEEGVGRG